MFLRMQTPLFISALLAFGLTGVTDTPGTDAIGMEDVAAAERLVGLEFTGAERDSMLSGLADQLANYRGLRGHPLQNDVPPVLYFDPLPEGFSIPKREEGFRTSPVGDLKRPANIEDIAFYSIGQLAELIRTRKITSAELTSMYLNRLKRYGPKLECVITLTEELAMKQARKADEEIAAGRYRGPLHGIPYGAKDLLATKGIKTTWGAMPFKEQMFDRDATVIRKLEEAGAVLVAKLTLGALAWGDVWFGGKTRNPWNYEQGSSGSSAGSASATAAGLVAFAIGSETWGSIVSPSTVCGTTGLRPTFGRVSRTGAMTLCWSMDKLGPICRNVEDCALVLNAIYGPDGADRSVREIPFSYRPEVDLASLHIGYLKSEFDSIDTSADLLNAALDDLRKLGARLIPVEVPSAGIGDLSIILSAEAGAAFDELLRTRGTDLMVRQIKDAWPNVFRLSRFIPAVEYLQANRIRYQIIEKMSELMDTIDVYVAPPFGDDLLLTNLTGHPAVVVPCGFTADGTPTSITFMGKLFDEGTVLAVAKKYQDATGFHLKHPELKE